MPGKGDAMIRERGGEDIKSAGSLLLDIGSLLMASGANTARIRITIRRIAEALHVHCELMITFRAITITLTSHNQDYVFSSVKRTSPHGVNFTIVSGISRMSWKVVEEKWTLPQIKAELYRVKQLPAYPWWMVVPLVALAGASFCRIAGGTLTDMCFVFISTATGLLVRKQAMHMGFNPYLAIFFASVAASFISGLAIKMGWVPNKEYAYVTAVLFLIPGVPLINSFSDIIDGNLNNGLMRGLHGLVISFSIALGLLTALFLYN